MRLVPCHESTDVEQRVQLGVTHSSGSNGPSCLDGRALTQMAHCFAHPDTSHSVFTGTAGCAAGRQLNSFSSCNISPFTLRSTNGDVPVAYDMADQSPFAKLLRTSLEEDSSLPHGRCAPPEAALPSSHVHRVILPRVQNLLFAAAGVDSSSSGPSSPAGMSRSSGAEEQSPQEDYPEHHQLNDIMHVIQQHAANPFAMRENATALTEELRAMLRIASCTAPTLGPAPDAATNPSQFICACLHRANLLFILADLLFMEHASVNPETGFGLANTPTSTTPNAACVKEAESLVIESLSLHDKAIESYREYTETRGSSRSSSPRVGGSMQTPSLMGASSVASSSATSDWEPSCVSVSAAADLEPELRSTRGKREQAVETLHEIASLDPWIPELELRPPEVAHAHRVSVEQAKSGLVWYYNSSNDSLKANRFRDDAMLWKMRRMSQEVNSQWEPADLLPHRSQAITNARPALAVGATTGLRAARAVGASAGATGSDDSRSRSAPLLQHAQHFRAPMPCRDPHAGTCPPEQHMHKLLREAQEAGDKELTISILARAIEHGAATSCVCSPTVLEPLIEHSYHIVSAANPTCATTNSTAVRLLQHSLTLLRDPSDVGRASSAEAAARLRLRRRALHALATALHQYNRVSEPLALHRRALAHALQHSGDPESVKTLEPRVHITALSVARLYMLSESGAEDLARVADRPDCCEGSWKTLYGRGRPGFNNRFFQPVVKRDNTAEVNNVTRWLHQNLQMGVRILSLHLLRLAHAASERLQNLPEPSTGSRHLPPRLLSPPPSGAPSNANLPLIHEAAGEAASASSQWGGDTDDLGITSSTDIGAGAPGEDVASDAEASSAPAGNRGIFRNVSQKSRQLKVGLGRNVASYAVLAAVEEDSKSWSVEDLVLLLQNTCEEADALARDAQTLSGFAVSQPPWVAHLCIPHWKVVHTLLSSNLPLAPSTDACSGPGLEQLTANLCRVLEIYSEYFCSSAAVNDGDSDTLCCVSLSASHHNTATSPSPLGGAPIRPSASEATTAAAAAPAMPPSSAPAARGSLSATPATSTTSSDDVPGSSSMHQSGAASEAPPNVYMPPDNLHTGNVRAASPLKQASAAAAPRPAEVADTPAKKLAQGLPEALCLKVPCTGAIAQGSDDSSVAGDACMSAFDIGDAPHGQAHGDPLNRPQESELRLMFARMYKIVDCGVGGDAIDDADAADAVASPASAMYLYPKIVSSLPLPKPAQHAQHVHPPPGAGHTSPTSTTITSPTPQSSLRLTYRSGSLSVSLPTTEAAAVSALIPKPTVESFGLEPDESTSISLGATPIPCMLAVCYGPEGASSASATPTSSSADRAGASTAEQQSSSAGSARSTATAAHVAGDEGDCCADDACPVESHTSLAAAGSPPGSPPALAAPPRTLLSKSTPVAIPPQSAEGQQHQHHDHPFHPSSYPHDTASSFEASGGGCSVMPFAPCGHIFGAGGTSLCTAALSDPMCAAAAFSPAQSSAPIADRCTGSSQPRGEFGSAAERDMHASECCGATAGGARRTVDSKANTFGSDEFNADAFNAVPCELRGTFCRSPPPATLQAVSAPVLVSAYSCWHTPRNEHACESFGDSGSPSSATEGDEGVFGAPCKPPSPTPPCPLGTSPLGPPPSTTRQPQRAWNAGVSAGSCGSWDESEDDVMGTSLQAEVPAVVSPRVPQYIPEDPSEDVPPAPVPSVHEASRRTLVPPAATDTSSSCMWSVPTSQGSRSSLRWCQSMAGGGQRSAPAPPPRPAMPFGGTASAGCFMPASGAQGAPPKDRLFGGGRVTRCESPPGLFRPPRPPSPCVDAGARKRLAQSNPGVAADGDGECGAPLSRAGDGPCEPAVLPHPAAVGGSSAPLLRPADSQRGGAFGGLLWGREGPGSAAGRMRARSVCLDNLDL